MYNVGAGWLEHMKEVRELCAGLPDLDLIIDVGAGDCEFLDSLDTQAVKLAVDPCEAVERAEELGLYYRREFFHPDAHIPDDTRGNILITMRHLLEHMQHPRDFIERIVTYAQELEYDTYLYVETPCCHEALKKTRIEDWTYEHPQHFTVKSMSKLFRACGIDYSHITLGYGGEVIKAVAKILPNKQKGILPSQVLENYANAQSSIDRVAEWIYSNRANLALWGGAGKSSTFINKLYLPTNVLVVDSHRAKWGYYVPGKAIKMQNPEVLKTSPVDYIIATASWRANDVAREIVSRGIECKQLLKFENGQLTEVPLG